MNVVAILHTPSLQRLTDLARRLLQARTATLFLSGEAEPRCLASETGREADAPLSILDAELPCPATRKVLGTLHVADAAPRTWTPTERDTLRDLAGALAEVVANQQRAEDCSGERDRLRALLDRVPGLVFERHGDGMPATVYGAGPEVMHRLIAAAADDALAFIHAEDRERVAAALADGSLGEGGVSLRTAGEAPRVLHCRSLAQSAADGAVVRSGVVLELAATRHADRSIADAGFELRTPLQSIVGVAELLRTETMPEAVAAHARSIQSAADALLAVVHRPAAAVGAAARTADAPEAPRFAEIGPERSGMAMLEQLVGPADGEAAGAEGAHILLADDLDLNRKLISDMLSIEGHLVDSVADGAAAVKAAREGSYDLILMDMIMPGMDGVAATRAIRALPAPACNVPIVALTAHSLPEQLDSCIQAGMDATLTKPMTMNALTDAVATWMRRRRKAA